MTHADELGSDRP